MATFDDILQALHDQQTVHCFLAEVVGVDTTAGTCNIQTEDGSSLDDIVFYGAVPVIGLGCIYVVFEGVGCVVGQPDISSDGGGGTPDTTPPSAPGDYLYFSDADSGFSSVTIGWEPASDDSGFVVYDVYKAEHISGSWQATTYIGSTAANTYTVGNLLGSGTGPSGVPWNFLVYARDLAGNLSPASPLIYASTKPQPQPGPPGNFVIARVTPGGVDLHWDPPYDPNDYGGGSRGVYHYELQRTDSNGNNADLDVYIGGTHFFDGAVAPGRAYRYQVRAWLNERGYTSTWALTPVFTVPLTFAAWRFWAHLQFTASQTSAPLNLVLPVNMFNDEPAVAGAAIGQFVLLRQAGVLGGGASVSIVGWSPTAITGSIPVPLTFNEVGATSSGLFDDPYLGTPTVHTVICHTGSCAQKEISIQISMYGTSAVCGVCSQPITDIT